MLFLAALAFAVTFYVVPLWWLLSNAVGGGATFYLIAAVWFAVCAGAVFALVKFPDFAIPEFPQWLADVTRRTGVHRLEWWGLAAAMGLATFGLLASPLHLPLALAAALGFGQLALTPIQRRALAPARVVFVPANLLPADLAPTVPVALVPETPPPTPPSPVPEGAERSLIREVVTKSYAWTYHRFAGGGMAQSFQLALLLPRYQRFRDKNLCRQHSPQGSDFGEYVTQGITAEVLDAARYFITETQRQEWSRFDEVSNVLCFAQDFPYSYDQDSVGIADYWRYPIEALHDETGDCECKSILAAAILRALGYEVLMLMLPGHAAIAVSGTDGMPPTYHFFTFRGKRFFYCETTAQGWKVGEVPAQYRAAEAEVFPV